MNIIFSTFITQTTNCIDVSAQCARPRNSSPSESERVLVCLERVHRHTRTRERCACAFRPTGCYVGKSLESFSDCFEISIVFCLK